LDAKYRFSPMLIPLAFVLGLLAGYLTWGRSPFSTPQAAPAAAAQAAVETAASAPAEAPVDAPAANSQSAAQPADAEPTQPVVRYDVSRGSNPVLGSPDAPITIIEFSDYECPYCRRWHLEVFPLIREAYPDQVNFVFRDFPLTSIHPNAVPAGEAARCAGEQGMFWEFNEALFSMQYGLNLDAYNAYAEGFGLDMAAFKECLDSARHQKEVLADLKWATDLGVRSTPTFFLNGIALVGAQPFEFFQMVIEKELAGEIP
jgi:protein-disulfide isomerase